jgi:hypothetical protein
LIEPSPGLGATNKNSEKFSEFRQNFQTSENSTDFSNCVPSKILRKNPRKFRQLAAPKNL